MVVFEGLLFCYALDRKVRHLVFSWFKYVLQCKYMVVYVCVFMCANTQVKSEY